MTEKEIKKIRNNNPRFENWKVCKLTDEQEKIHKELDCREMINSCLCYGTDFLNSKYKNEYIKELGEDRVIELYNEQKADFDKAIVYHNVYVDGEDVSYNSIKWNDEKELEI